MGLALHNTRAVVLGFWGKATPFICTPKQGSGGGVLPAGDKVARAALARSRGTLLLAEGLLTLYFAAGLGAGFYYHDLGLLPFHLLLVAGHGTLTYYGLRQRRPAVTAPALVPVLAS